MKNIIEHMIEEDFEIKMVEAIIRETGTKYTRQALLKNK